jgi:hypothetical protein
MAKWQTCSPVEAAAGGIPRTTKTYAKKARPFIIRYVPNAGLMRPYVHPLNVVDFKGIRVG